MNLAEHVLRNRYPGRIALVCGEERLTRDELAARVARAADALRSLGVRPGESVLFVMRDTPEFAAAWLGAIHGGAIAAALNTKLTLADYQHVLADSAAKLALVDDAFTEARAAFGERAISLPAWRVHVGKATAAAPWNAEPDAPALRLYSSGTTGRPKGIVHAHRAALSIGEAFRALGIGEGERVFTSSKFFFAYGLEHGLLAPLAMGVTSILNADWPDAEAVLGIIERHRPHAVFGVPTIYRRLAAAPSARLASLRAVRHFGRLAHRDAVSDRRGAAARRAGRRGGAGRARRAVAAPSGAGARLRQPAGGNARAVPRRLVLLARSFRARCARLLHPPGPRRRARQGRRSVGLARRAGRSRAR